MPRDFIPYGRHDISEEDISSVVKVLRSSHLTQGDVVPAFEAAICTKVSSRYAVATTNATSALHLACLALEVGFGDYVWTSPITFVASANCALFCGAFVDFVDISPETGLLDINLLAQKLYLAKQTNTLPKVVIPVHLAGVSCDMKALYSLSSIYGFHILEDASHAIGGRYQNKPVGACSYSKITVFSLHPVKIITSGEGGIATTNDSSLASRMTELRSHGITKDPSRFIYKSPGPWFYEQQSLGFNYRLTDIQAALGLSQLSRLDSIISRRNELFSFYLRNVESLPIRFLHIPIDVLSSVHLAIFCLIDPNPLLHYHIFDFMRNKGIGVQLHYIPVHLQPFFQKLGFNRGQFPNSESYAHSAVSLPLFPSLSHSEQLYILESLHLAFSLWSD